ncbi:MAG TPA: PQQ-dependent sugar dehydrogenase [Candidatus Desulfobacillus denitrificans]|nr:PQQ-dependent sugar dehydrogenase [Candidatus Desulfobacillus denitrificans]HNT63290.1 PQQ-dependent sugar dehydrogenase [Candidatus Desulfobacillus denitrificans]
MRAMTIALCCAATATQAQINAGALPAQPGLPFVLHKVAGFEYPWRIAFLPDGRLLVTEKPGALWLVTQQGEKTRIAGAPAVLHQGQGGLLGVFLSPHYRSDGSVYLTYAEPGAGGSGLALARARLELSGSEARLADLRVLWREMPKGRGGQFGAQVAFAPDGRHLFLAVGERQRMTPAQDPDSALGKILRLTLDGQPAPGNPMAGREGARTVTLIDPPRDTEAAKDAPVVRAYRHAGPNLAPAETWTSGHRNPYGLAFAPDGRLWSVEHGPRGGDELNLIEPGHNYGWPLVSCGMNYDGVPIPAHDARPEFARPVLYWTPVIAPGNLAFYRGAMFPQWNGSALVSGLGSRSLSRIVFDGKGGAAPAERWNIGFRVRDVAVAPDGALWLLEDAADDAALVRTVPK